METKTQNYAVAVRRTATDYILISATSEEEARIRAEVLMQEHDFVITLGDDDEDREITGAELSQPDGTREREDLQANNEAWNSMLDSITPHQPIAPSSSKIITLSDFGDFSEDEDAKAELEVAAHVHGVEFYPTYYDHELKGERGKIEALTLDLWGMKREEWAENALTETEVDLKEERGEARFNGLGNPRG